MAAKNPSGAFVLWPKARCAAVAARYATRKQFKTGCQMAYLASRKMGWLDEVCSHMPPNTHKAGLPSVTAWTLEQCRALALRYASRGEFRRRHAGAYSCAARKGWLDDICSHMARQGSLDWRIVYEIISDDQRTVYVGLTANLGRRLDGHRRQGTARVRSLLATPHRVDVSDLMPPADAADRELERVDFYRRNGWSVLNAAKAGALGAARRYWTKTMVAAAARPYQRRSDFQRGNRSAYMAARAYGWIDDACRHMQSSRHTWTIEAVKSEARHHGSKAAFKRNSESAYNAALRKGWLDEACSHMEPKLRKWTTNDLRSEAAKHRRRVDFQRGNHAAYQAARLRGLLDDICAHMKAGRQNWSNDDLHTSARRFQSRGAFELGDPNAYQAALRRGMIDDVCQHMLLLNGWSRRKRKLSSEMKACLGDAVH